MFRSEAHLVRHFVRLLDEESPWGPLRTLTEWDYASGYTDVLARNLQNELIAFEAKLTDWRHACLQAYRNTTFASLAYVVLPEATAQRIHIDDATFSRYGVGLCSCGAGGLKIRIVARRAEPLMEWLTTSAHSDFDRMVHVKAGHRERRRVRLQAA